MRGKVQIRPATRTTRRITPAYAGKRSFAGQAPVFLRGSPPPMRGKDGVPELHRQSGGITPAYAGKSASPLGTDQMRQDHPRLCGEKTARPEYFQKYKGSPPPMRGKGIPTNPVIILIRITPAYAGKRYASIEIPPSDRDHPRLCGEKVSCSVIVAFVFGSPPPMRGKVQRHSFSFAALRITPAYAGKRINPDDFGENFKDHPRLCGEKAFRTDTAQQHGGSPPPMRGKGALTIEGVEQRRITPAYAGKSPPVW